MRRFVVTGAAGFLGSHICDVLLDRGDSVVGVDNFCTGRLDNLSSARCSSHFLLVEQDVCDPIDVSGHVDCVLHLASPASPPEYLKMPLETLHVGSRGTESAISLALAHGARFVLASTSEVYGEPQEHPQRESYWGNVNPVGPRSVYDEAKRYAEALTMAYVRSRGLDGGIVRIFNTYGPRLRPSDGRVVSNFVSQALDGSPLTVYGDGTQTRSFCFVDDLVRGFVAMADVKVTGPVNIGNPDETTVRELAERVVQMTGSASKLETRPLPADDPTRRRPDITLARQLLGWAPSIGLEEGLERTIAWFVEMRDYRAAGTPSCS